MNVMGKLKEWMKRVRLLQPCIILWRKLRLLAFSYWHLPREVRTPLATTDAFVVFSTRNWATANFCKNNTSGEILDYEPDQRDVFQSLDLKDAVMFDVGAQIGYYAIIAAKLGARRVIGFEVDKGFLNAARGHVLRNGVGDRVQFLNIAIGEDGQHIAVENFSGVSRMQSVSLDTFCKKEDVWPDVIKMDIEGSELEALENAEAVLHRRPIILLGLHPRFIRARGHSPGRVLEILLDRGFRLVALTGHLRGEEVSRGKIDAFLTWEALDFVCGPDNNITLDRIVHSLQTRAT